MSEKPANGQASLFSLSAAMTANDSCEFSSLRMRGIETAHHERLFDRNKRVSNKKAAHHERSYCSAPKIGSISAHRSSFRIFLPVRICPDLDSTRNHHHCAELCTLFTSALGSFRILRPNPSGPRFNPRSSSLCSFVLICNSALGSFRIFIRGNGQPAGYEFFVSQQYTGEGY
jgi:hypothetical protein